MRPSFFATLAGMLALAGVSVFQPVELHAGTPLTGACDNAPCLSQATLSQNGELDQAPPPQMLAFEIKIRLKCPDGFRREDGECVRKRKKNKGGGGCVVGFHWNGNRCVPDGQGKKKTKNEFPPIEGQEDDGGFSCSHNDHMENGRCVPCRKGFHVEGDECVPD
jgi:hypothetical protein